MSLEFYWKGSDELETNTEGVGDGYSTSTYWNNPDNWFIKVYTDKSDSQIFTTDTDEFGYVKATRVPRAGDKVFFTALGSDPALGLNGGPWPKSPCLFGGMALTGASGDSNEWIGATGTTLEKTGKCELIVVDKKYGSEFSDPNSLTSLKGWKFGKFGSDGETGATQDGVAWDGLYLSANEMYTNAEYYGVSIKEFIGGDFYRLGGAMLEMSGGSAENFTYSQDDGIFYDGTLPASGSTPHGRLSQTWVTCNVINTLRIDADELYAGWWQHVSDVKTKNIIVSPRRCGLNYFAFYGNAERVEIYPYLLYTSGTESVNPSPTFKLYGKLNSERTGASGSSVYDLIKMYDSNKYYDVEFTGGNQDVTIESSSTIERLETSSGNFRIGDLASTDFVHINSGVIQYNTNMYLYGSNYDTQIKLGEDGTDVETNAINVVSDDRPQFDYIAYRKPNFYFAPGTYSKCKTQTVADTLNSETTFTDEDLSKAKGGVGFPALFTI